MNATEAIIILIFFTIIIVAIIALITSNSAKTTCPVIEGKFALVPTMKGTTLTNCGNNNNEPCVRQIETMNDAIQYCQQYQCHQFFVVNTGYSVELTDNNLKEEMSGNTYITQVGYVS